ncbi:Ig-like domain-containing protein [Kitasatospora sp. SC0581]|uniref:Ig-like domain-containing protein n=1 Tax=Kitasatospora sp. SC0581 TaxID=3394360 RepID=UPI003A8B0F7E
MSRQFPRTAVALAVLASGLLTAWNVPLAAALQSPDTRSAEHRAVPPSGLPARVDLDAAPQEYGIATHVASDLLLGAGATAPARTGRSGADVSIALPFPTEAAIGRYYRLTVPVAVGDRPATLAGWIDFGRTGRFDPAQRVQTEIPAGAATATLEWTVPPGAASGETWARLRIGRDAGQLVSSGGFADSGQAADQRIELTVGAARPEIAEPVAGAVLADARPQVSGHGAVAGATVEVREGDTVLCRTEVGSGGDWSCRPGTELAVGPHALTPVETTGGGVVLRGDPVTVDVKTVPPGAPTLTVPAYTNDPGLRLTGTGEAGSTVSVLDEGSSDELCITGVPAGGAWSCLPVEDLTDGKHLLTPVAVDRAGNRTAGLPVSLVVSTALPGRPVLTSPAPGETVRVSRPKLAGRADPGTDVLVTTGADAGAEPERRTVLCGATTAFDGSWSCTANRDLAAGEQWLTVTATDRAGNAASAEPVPVRVATTEAAPAPGASSPAVPSAAAQSSVLPSLVLPSAAAPSATATATATASGPGASSPTAAVSASSSAASPVAARPGSPTPVASGAAAVPSGPAKPSPSAQGAAVASPTPSVVAAPAEVPVAVPPLGARPVTASPVGSGPSAGPSAGPSRATPGPAKTVAAASAASTRPVVPTLSTAEAFSPSLTPAPATGHGAPAAAVVAVRPGPSPAGAADPVDSAGPAGDAVPPLAAPPVETAQGASGRSGATGWRGGIAGFLLVLTGLGLITRRVFARRPGAPRR